MPARNMKVAVAMSGGVDSSVAAVLLKEQGYDVIGITMALWSCHKNEAKDTKTCCSLADVQDARNVCEKIGIPHVMVDYRKEFKEKVIDHFAAEYSRGRTPIPCIQCNQHFKFERLWETARDEYGAAYIATGHYARILSHGVRLQSDTMEALRLLKGFDGLKDQSYFLFVMTPEQLAHSLFPIGDLTKEEVRAIAVKHGLLTAEKPDSQEVCFVPDNDYSHFIEQYYPDTAGSPGEFVGSDGAVLSRHRGTHAFTIGQRRGLGMAFGDRMYVTAIDPAAGRVTLGREEELYSRGLVAGQVNWIRKPANEFEAAVKIRYKHEPARGLVMDDGDGTVSVRFRELQKAITPGQAVVFYSGDEVLGGGWIERSYRD